MAALKPLGIYIHVPFCRSKCEYCDFYSLGGSKDRSLMEQYLDAVTLHIREAARQATGYLVDTIYFGGGTPSFFGADGLARILREIDRRFAVTRDAEVSFEANPDSADLKTLKALHRAGFNRVSLGVQSDLDEQLKALGRPHNYDQAVRAVNAARDAGFDNLSLDLMYGLPNQSREMWASTLEHVVSLKPNHMSCYGLKVEPGTPLYDYREYAGLPDDDAQADMYLFCVETLESYGFFQYEISNFAQPGFDCQHNLKYWTGGEYLGFGPAAASDFAGKRFTCAPDLACYIEGIRTGGSILSECDSLRPSERAGEYLMLRLRTSDGIEADEYNKTFRMSFAPLEKELHAFEEQGLARLEGGRWRFTPKGFLLSNELITRLLLAQQESSPLKGA
ncbi:MAG: radical SAM family heme chaperone HemW [Oscillospiraceae bacterium]|nr:radical SAM family heme chaperone HemW [Oscillospiraceae bacterium]